MIFEILLFWLLVDLGITSEVSRGPVSAGLLIGGTSLGFCYRAREIRSVPE